MLIVNNLQGEEVDICYKSGYFIDIDDFGYW